MSDAAELPAAVARCADQLSRGALETLTGALREGADRRRLEGLVPSDHFRALAGALAAAWERRDDVPAAALALALESAAAGAATAAAEELSLVWSGPETSAVPVRRTEQALLELVGAARSRLLVVSFVVTRIAAIAAALVEAAGRGVEVTLILESEEESGRAGFERAGAVAADLTAHARLFTWPRERRPRDGRGNVASLHAKCAVADGELLLLSSANLTEAAMERNMELGLLVRGGSVPARVQTHFDHLLERGELVPVDAR